MSEWKAARVGDICKSANGRAFKPTEWDTEGAPIIRIQNLKNDSAPFNYFRGEIEPRFRVQHGDLLFAWSGTPGTSFGAHIWRGGDAVLNQHIFNLHFDRTKIDERFFCYALNRNVADYVAKAQGGVGLAHITKGKFEDSFVPLPDIAEQRAVVAEIEKQFSRLDEAVAGLKRVKANLKRYKAAILKAAVEGRLVPTEADLARRESRNYETGAQLLQCILDTRRKQWQGKGKYKEPAEPDITALPELPEGWEWASPEQVSAGQPYSLAIGPFGSSLKVSDYTTAGVPLVFVRNIRSESFGGSGTVFVSPQKADELKAHLVEPGDLLITKMGAPPGDVCVYPANHSTAVITADCIKLRLIHDLLPIQFFAYTIESKLVHKQILGITKGVAQLKVSLGRFSTIGLPVPPLAEQHRIVAEVDRRLSIAREAEAEVEINLKRAKALRQATLQRAFSSQAFSGVAEVIQ